MFLFPDSRKRENNEREGERERGCVCETSASPSPGFGTKNIRYSFPRGRKGEMTSTEVGYLYSGKEG